MRDYYDYDYDNNSDYGRILNSDNPTAVTSVSMLRHYLNVHGCTQKLIDYLGLDIDTIYDVRNVCFGSTPIKDIMEDADLCMDNAIKDREAKEQAIIKNEQLLRQLKEKRKTLCGMGTRRVKLLLNSLVKKGDKIAKLYRLILEAEDVNIQAKGLDRMEWRDSKYYQKEQIITELLGLCREWSEELGIGYGKQTSNVRDTDHIVYFDLPDMEQISFHTTLADPSSVPDYTGEWDGRHNSSLPKIEEAIIRRYRTGVEEKIGK